MSRTKRNPNVPPTGGRGSSHGSTGQSGRTGRGGTPFTPDTPVPDTDDPRSNYYENFYTSGDDAPGYHDLWSAWTQLLTSGVVNERSLNEILSGLAHAGIMTSAKDSYIQWAIEQMLKNAMTQEQRRYDKGVLEEQRIYDNPTNQLARLMGAGISRDAAIQSMTGGSGASGAGSASPLIGSGSQNALASNVDPTNVLNGELNKANTIMNAFATVASFAKMGVSMRQMSVQTAGQNIANELNQGQLDGINSANKVVSTFSNLVTDGTISPETVKGFKNAQDLLDYALDHKDTNGFKGIFEDGSFQNVYGTSYGRNALNSLWTDLLDTRSTGTQLDQKLNAMDNQLTLQNMTKMDFVNKIQQGILMNAHLQNQLQQDIIDLLDGAIQLEINGEILSQERINTLLAGFEFNQAETENRIFDAIYNTKDEEGHTGVYYASLAELNELYKYATVSSAERSAMTEQWIDNYQRSFYESGRNILLGLLLKNAYAQGSLDMFTTADVDAVGGNVYGGDGNFTTNRAGDAVILVNQTPLLQGINLIRSSANEFDYEAPSGSGRSAGRRAAGEASRAAARGVIRRVVTKTP